jgi:hypothetical protein
VSGRALIRSARSLPSLDQAVLEAVVLAAYLLDEAMPGLVLDYRGEDWAGGGRAGRPQSLGS